MVIPKPTDAILIELARIARVRPAHIFHFVAYRKAVGERFTSEGYAAFAQMELAHVARMVEAVPIEPAKPRRQRAAAPIGDAFEVPQEWRLWAQTQRGWTQDVADTVAASFVDYWRGTGKAMVDWQATWRNWVRRDKRDDGAYRASEPMTAEQRATGRETTIRLYRRMGRHQEADELERQG